MLFKRRRNPARRAHKFGVPQNPTVRYACVSPLGECSAVHPFSFRFWKIEYSNWHQLTNKRIGEAIDSKRDETSAIQGHFCSCGPASPVRAGKCTITSGPRICISLMEAYGPEKWTASRVTWGALWQSRHHHGKSWEPPGMGLQIIDSPHVFLKEAQRISELL